MHVIVRPILKLLRPFSDGGLLLDILPLCHLGLTEVHVTLLTRSHEYRAADTYVLFRCVIFCGIQYTIEVTINFEIFVKQDWLPKQLGPDTAMSRCDHSIPWRYLNWRTIDTAVMAPHNESICGTQKGRKTWMRSTVRLKVTECFIDRDQVLDIEYPEAVGRRVSTCLVMERIRK